VPVNLASPAALGRNRRVQRMSLMYQEVLLTDDHPKGTVEPGNGTHLAEVE
jgi:hypothetical protein